MSSDGGFERIPLRATEANARLKPRLVRSDQTLNDLQKDNETLKTKVRTHIVELISVLHLNHHHPCLVDGTAGQGAGGDGATDEATQARAASGAA